MRRTTITLTAVTSAMILASCGGGGSADDADLKGDGAGESCVIDQPVPVGAAISLTGAAAGYGESQRKGLELARDELNAKKGVEYDLTVEDEQGDPRQGISAFEKFVSDGASVIVGPTLSTVAFSAQPVAQEASVPVLSVSNTAEGITAQGDYIYRAALTEAQVIPQTVKTSKESLGYERVVVMYANDDSLAESGYKAFAKALEDEGVEVLDTLTFSKADTDFRSLLTEAKNAKPDAIVASTLIEAAIPLVTQARELGIDLPIVGGNGFNTSQLAADAGEAAEGVVVGAAWNSSSDNPENTAFLKAFDDAYGEQPDQFAAQAYAGLKLVDLAVRAGCSATREDLKKNFATLQNVPTVLGELSINEDRDSEHEAVVQIVEDGKFAVLD